MIESTALAKCAFLLGIALIAVACQASSDTAESSPRSPESLGRWTSEFTSSSLLIADSIRIEGPPALRIHMALPQDAVALNSVTKATNDGLLQVFTLRAQDGSMIRANLDNWQIVATKRLEVLERPNETDVRIVARGNAAWLPTDPKAGERELRGVELLLTGKLER